jgi:outer membrane autotransporter protein
VGQAKPGTFLSEGIITTADGIDLDKLQLNAPTSAVATFALQKVDSGRNLAFNYTVNYAPSGLNPNGTAVGQAVNQIQAAGSTTGFEPTAALIFAQQNTGQLNTLYQQLSGATNTVFPQVAIDAAQGFQEDVLTMLKTTPVNQSQRCLQQLQQLKPGEDYKGYPEDCGKWQGWFIAGGYNATTPGQGSSNQSGYNTAAFNSMAGADALIGPNTILGAAARYDNLSTTTTPGQSAYGNTQGWSGLLYAKQRLGQNTWLTGLLGSGGFGTNITRQVSVQNPSTEQSTSQSTALGGALTLSQVIKTADAGSLAPRIGISWMQLNQGSYNESTSSSNTAYQQPGNPLISYPNPGKASYSLNYASAAYTSTPLEIGVDFKHPLKAGKMVFTPRLSVGYAWDLSNTARNLTAQFQAAQTASFSVVGTPAPGSWWNLGLGFDLAINQRTSLYADTRGQLSPGSTQAINYNGGIRWRF